MYIVCAPKSQIAEMEVLLQNVDTYPLPLIDFEFDLEKLDYIAKNINNFDYVMLSSPSGIDKLGSVLAQAQLTTFLTVGSESAKRLRQYTNNEIIYPQFSSGQSALLKENLANINFVNKNVLVIKGNNDKLYEKLFIAYPNWKRLSLYKSVSLKIDGIWLKKAFELGKVQGMIVTSSTLVEELFKVVKLINCLDMVKKINFITIHPKIKKTLQAYGVQNILVTQRANKKDIVNIINNRCI